MKRLRHIFATICLGGACTFAANTDEPGAANAESAAKQSIASDLQRLQGTWKGFMAGHEKSANITVRIDGESLHFHRDADFWFKTKIKLPAGKIPKQLHATIKECPPSQASSSGEVVRAFFKIKDETLTLATIGEGAEETQKAFETAGTRYKLRKVRSRKKKVEGPSER